MKEDWRPAKRAPVFSQCTLLATAEGIFLLLTRQLIDCIQCHEYCKEKHAVLLLTGKFVTILKENVLNIFFSTNPLMGDPFCESSI